MAKGIIYLMSTVVEGLIKIGQTDNYESRMRYLEKNGYCNVTGLKREFAIEVDDYLEKEKLLHSIFSKSRLGDTELFSVDLDLAKQLLSAFDGKVIYPKESKETIFSKATDALEEKEILLDKNRHHIKEFDFTSSLTGHRYHCGAGEEGTLCIIDLTEGKEVPNNSKPSKKQILASALKDLGNAVDENWSSYQIQRRLQQLLTK